MSDALRDVEVGELSVCEDCMFDHANGDLDEARSVDLPPVWGRIPFGYTVTMGGEHNEGCPNRPEFIGEECDCGDLGFRQYDCDACGDWHHGDRYRFTLWATSDAMAIRWARSALATARQFHRDPNRVDALYRSSLAVWRYSRLDHIEHAARWRTYLSARRAERARDAA